jgi:hypothetical protein
VNEGMNRRIPALLIGLSILLPTCLLAAGKAKGAEAPWYEFEVLIFQRLDQGAGSTELWPGQATNPDLQNAIPFNRKGKAALINGKPIAYRPLPVGERRLRNIWNRFRNSRNYRPLYHVAWRQQVVDPDRAKALYISLPPEDGQPASPSNPAKLEGTVKIGVKRYLHMSADLQLRQYVDGQLINYPLKAQRRMRSGKLHYIDHPVLGILVQAEKYVPPAPEPEPVVERVTPTEQPAATTGTSAKPASEAAQPQR